MTVISENPELKRDVHQGASKPESYKMVAINRDHPQMRSPLTEPLNEQLADQFVEPLESQTHHPERAVEKDTPNDMTDSLDSKQENTFLKADALTVVWDDVLDEVSAQLSGPSFETWIAPLRLFSCEASTLDDPNTEQENPTQENTTRVTLQTSSTFNRDWVLKHYRSHLQEAFTKVLQADADLVFEVVEFIEPVEQLSLLGDDVPQPVSKRLARQMKQKATQKTNDDANTSSPNRKQVAHAAQRSVQMDAPSSTGLKAVSDDASWRPWTPRSQTANLNPRYTFEQFVVGSHNHFCHAAALAVAESPAISYNPFFVYGGVGIGKSHLMQAIGHFVNRHHQDLVVRYVTAEQFTNELITAIGNKQMKQFRDKYRRNDVLIIDDVQFLEGKERTQEEVFHTFNALHSAGKQVILSSDRNPKLLSRLEPRLRSRFEWGLIADMQTPDVETRLAILNQKSKRDKVSLPDDVMTYIADNYPNNIRELEGAFNKVSAYSSLTKTIIDLPMAQQILGITMEPANISVDKMIKTVASYYHMQASDIKSQLRAKDISHARQVAIYLIRELTESSFPKIGQAIGGRKHTTILYAYEKVKKEMEVRPQLKQQIQELSQQIKQLT